MLPTKPTRTIKDAIDLDTMRNVSSDDLLNNGIDYSQTIRHQATERKIDGNPRYVCAMCGYAVYVSNRSRKPLWRHYKNAPINCPWWTGNPQSVKQISAQQFNGNQESPLHLKLKNTIAELLKNDPNVSDVLIEERIVSENTSYRIPDVQAKYGDKKVVFEIQLATTQLPILIERENHYKKNGIFLIWIVWNFTKQPLEKISQAFLDVYKRHNQNILSINDASIEKSETRKTLVLNVFADRNNIWEEKEVQLDDLIWDTEHLPHYYPSKRSWQEKFREKWLNNTTRRGTLWESHETLFTEIFDELKIIQTDNFEKVHLIRLINAILSIEKGIPIGTSENNLVAYTNSFFNSKNRYKFHDIYVFFLKEFNRKNVLNAKSVKEKLSVAKSATQILKDSTEARAIRLIFQDFVKRNT